jgi:hypothetical protein
MMERSWVESTPSNSTCRNQSSAGLAPRIFGGLAMRGSRLTRTWKML